MSRLTTRAHWDTIWQSRSPGSKDAAAPAAKPARRFVQRLLGDQLLSYRHPYNDYLLWKVLFRDHLPRRPGLKAIEIGSAPGHRLVRLGREYGYVPYGVEYSESGVEWNRRVFAEAGIPPENVIKADFFDSGFQASHRQGFDVVISWSFMEHFDDAQDVADKHANLAAADGVVVVMVPNLRGLNRRLGTFFQRDYLELHNLDIMAPTRLQAAFERAGLQTCFCGYSGFFSFWRFQTRPDSAKRHLLRACQSLQPALNVFCRMVFRQHAPERAWYSPDIIYVGRKAASPCAAGTVDSVRRA